VLYDSDVTNRWSALTKWQNVSYIEKQLRLAKKDKLVNVKNYTQPVFLLGRTVAKAMVRQRVLLLQSRVTDLIGSIEIER